MSLEGWKHETEPLNEYELDELLPRVIKGLTNRYGVDRAITQSKAVAAMKREGYKINGARFRKIINHIRTKDIIKDLIASSKGYYISDSIEDSLRYLRSLAERERAIRQVRQKVQKQIAYKYNYQIDLEQLMNQKV